MAIALKDLLEERLKRSTSPTTFTSRMKAPLPLSSSSSSSIPQQCYGLIEDSGGRHGGSSSIEFLLSSSPPVNLRDVPQNYRPLMPTTTPSIAINYNNHNHNNHNNNEVFMDVQQLSSSTPTPTPLSSLLTSKSRKERKRRLRMSKFPTQDSKDSIDDEEIFQFSSSIGGAFGSLGEDY